MAARAAPAVGDTAEFALWFGAWSEGAGETVRAGLKAVHRELAAGEVVALCLDGRSEDCKDGTYAYVLYARPRVIHLCPVFFAMPSMADARAGTGDQEDGTREGTIVHELSHFGFVAGTDDHCYSRTECAGLAATDPGLAVANADSFQYFAEDVTLAFWAAGARSDPLGARAPLPRGGGGGAGLRGLHQGRGGVGGGRGGRGHGARHPGGRGGGRHGGLRDVVRRVRARAGRAGARHAQGHPRGARGRPLRVDCEDDKDRTCRTAFAFVTPGQPGVVNLCPSFFGMPTLAEMAEGAEAERGTREGTLIHELSHFPHAGGTEDDCYSRTTCESLARSAPATAVDTADSYQYFAEDVSLGP
jgi:peptidyl-Lys metalloendopeptidase